MSDEVETMAYRADGGIPWHWKGHAVSNDMTPEQMMNASGTNWEVYKKPMLIQLDNGDYKTVPGRNALVRTSDNEILDVVGGDDWFTTQNHEAFAFFKEYVEKGEMIMETAGSLQGGKVVWVLAKIKEMFELFGGDRVQGFLLFSNYHKYGQSRDVRNTPIRVVCSNTLAAAISGKSEKVFRASHRVNITKEMIQDTLGMASKGMSNYKDLAMYLGSKEYTDESLIEFFTTVFPTNSLKEGNASRNAQRALEAIESQPGAEFARNTWWQAANAVTYMTDHVLGRSAETRTYNMLYGQAREMKVKAFRIAKQFADQSA